jgi:uncharacterized Rmd1/YagE family protein
MQTYDFRSSVISIEINLSKIAGHFGIDKKFKWEEPLILDEKQLKGIIPQPQNKFIYVFHFGSIAFINLTIHEAKDIINYLKKIDKNLKTDTSFGYIEDFRLLVNEEAEFELRYDSIIINKLNQYHMDIIATILAKSVALKKIEHDTDILLDEIENIIEYLDKGHLNLSDEQLAKLSAKVLRFKYNTISYIMLLEKPDIAWKIEEAFDFFNNLSELFEIKDRYEKIRNKTEVLLDITEVFSGLTHAKRGTRLEWMVIILILIELLMSVASTIFKYL